MKNRLSPVFAIPFALILLAPSSRASESISPIFSTAAYADQKEMEYPVLAANQDDERTEPADPDPATIKEIRELLDIFPPRNRQVN